jgi:hypothetical protein
VLTSVHSPVLVNVSSWRLIVGFAMSFKATDWVQDMGFLAGFGVYSAALAAASIIGLPIVYIYGKRIRDYTAGRLAPAVSDKERELEMDNMSVNAKRNSPSNVGWPF